MRTIDAGEIDGPVGYVSWKGSPWDVLEEVDELLKPFGLEVVQIGAGSDCFWTIVKIGEVVKYIENE